MEVKASNECDKIVENINKMTEIAVEAIQVAQERAKTAEQILGKVKQTLSDEINNAYRIGFDAGLKYKNESDNDSGGTAKAKEDIAKLVLETKN